MEEISAEEDLLKLFQGECEKFWPILIECLGYVPVNNENPVYLENTCQTIPVKLCECVCVLPVGLHSK